MKRRILLAGNNPAIIDKFFYRMADDFECQSTSMRWDDVACHAKYFEPEMFIFCMRDDQVETGSRMSSLFEWLKGQKIPYGIVGNKEACAIFMSEITIEPELILTKPITATMIRDSIEEYLSDAEEERAKEEAFAAAKAAAKAAEEAGKRKHVLVVDDDPRMLKVIKEYLHEAYDVAVAVSGKVALRFLESKPTDIILLDYMMPEMDGPAVFKKIRKMKQHQETPIVFLTGISERDKIQQVMGLHPQGYLLKPVERERVLSTIKGLIE